MSSKEPRRSSRIAGLVDAAAECWECAPSEEFLESIFPQERVLVEKAVGKRRAEFAAARVLAHRAMEALGFETRPVLRHEKGAPSWPDGILGTITHTHGYCAVAVARASEVRGLGIDAEPYKPLTQRITERICTDDELAWLEQHPPEARGLLSKLVFSAKESFYKCQFPITRTYLGFKDVSLVIDEERRAFRVAYLGTLEGADRQVMGALGRYEIADERIVTTMTLHKG